MLKVGDTVKVIAQDEIFKFNTIGYIGKIIEINNSHDCKLDNNRWYGEEQLINLKWSKNL